MTPDGRYFVVRGGPWRTANPGPDEVKQNLRPATTPRQVKKNSRKRFPMLQVRIYDAQTKVREEVPDSLNLDFLALRLGACGNGRIGLS